MKHRSKQMREDRMGEGKDEVDNETTKTTRISLSFPLNAGLPDFTGQKHCSSSHPTMSSDVSHSNDMAWMGEPFRDRKLPKLVSKSERLGCSPSYPVDLTASSSKNCKSSLSFSIDGSGSQYPTSSLKHSNKPDYSKETAGANLNNGYKEHSTTETAHILFNLSARAYQDQGMKDPDSSKGKKRKANSLHVELSLPLPSINSHSSTATPPSPLPSSSTVSLSTSSPLPLPSPSFHDSFKAEPKPELLCGVCHRLFSTASSLTVHMRLHRGGRVLSCRHCGKAFIHNKRLQSHEATCRQGLPAFPMPPKEEILEEGEVEGERADEAEEPGQETRPSRPIKKARDLHDNSDAATMDGVKEEDHFAKLVDGHIIYFCSVCERSYMTLSSLKRHSNVHSWRRKYPCHFCDKVFALAEYRTKHEVWHTGERRYQCIFCWEAFPTYYNLKTHQKAFHGINPGLISSEKTVNGGYKQKVNALKLYRLLPMRSLKRPYKTYSQSMADGLLTSDSPEPLPLSIDGNLPTPLDTKKLESFLKDLQNPDVKTEPEGYPIKVVESEQYPDVLQAEAGAEDGEKCESNVLLSGKNPGKGKGPGGAVSSVIAFAHRKPSVIMHSTAVSSSVIVQRKIDSDVRKKCPENVEVIKSPHKISKRHSQKEHTETKVKRVVGMNSELSEIRQLSDKHHKGRKAHRKSEMSKSTHIAVGSDVKGSGPLCQITVRIGEEAIVKRSISETDLMRDKIPTRNKLKRSNLSQDDQRQKRHTRHHQSKHKRFTQEGTEGEHKWKNPKVRGKMRKYFFRQEVREDRNDRDVEDNLWRPYYSYKPKRKALHLQGAKAWKRKMHYKRSLRPIRRAEQFLKNIKKNNDHQDKNDGEGDRQDVKVKQSEPSCSQECQNKVSSSTEPNEKATDRKLDRPLPSSVTQTLPNPQFAASSITKQRCSEGQATECGTCGQWFSTPGKRDEHELTHLFEFVCMFCRATFPSQSKLEEHQKTQHPKNKSQSMTGFLTSQSLGNEMEKKPVENGLIAPHIDKGSPLRLGRRPLIRYTCSKCDKVCKTSAALNCHLKRHELGSSSEVEDMEKKTEMPVQRNSTVSATAKMPSEEAHSVSVIYYSKPDCQITVNQADEKMHKNQRINNCQNPKVAANDQVNSLLCAQFPQIRHSNVIEKSKDISPTLPSALVMNGVEYLGNRTMNKQKPDTSVQQKVGTKLNIVHTDPQMKTKKNLPGPKSLTTDRSCVFSQGLGLVTQKGDTVLNENFKNSNDPQDLRIFPKCSNQAQDLSMSRKNEPDQKPKHVPIIGKVKNCSEEVPLLVPKEEPLSPIPSPTCSVIQTTPKGLSQRYTKSPCHSPRPLDLQFRPHVEQNQPLLRGRHNTEKQCSKLLENTTGLRDSSSSSAMLHRQVPTPEKELKDGSVTSTQHLLGYPVQDQTFPLVLPEGFCSSKKREEPNLMSYPTGHLPFSPIGKMVPHSDLTKLPFYPDPYHLLYGPQLLPYPYNLAAIPMALNMMASGDKEHLPFLPFFNYATPAPLTGTVPHPLMVNPNLYNSGGSSSTKQNNP